MLCTGSGCDRANKCGLYYRNPQPEYRKYDNLESLSTFGVGSLNETGCNVEYYCGSLGNYKMFTPLADQFWHEKIAECFNAINVGFQVTAEHVKSMVEQLKEIEK